MSTKEEKWLDSLYTEEELHEIFEYSNGFSEDVNINHPFREEGESFEDFMNRGSDLLIKENLPLVRSLLRR